MLSFDEFKAKNLLSKYAHDVWSRWVKSLFSKSYDNSDGSITIPKDLVLRWKRQMTTEYEDLTKEEQKSDQVEADNILDVIKSSQV